MRKSRRHQNFSWIVVASLLLTASPSHTQESSAAGLVEQNFLEQLASARKAHNKKLEVGVLGELGMFYSQTGQFQKAQSQYLQALELGQKASGANHPDVARICANLGFVYQQTKNFKKAEPVLLKAMGILGKTKRVTVA